MNALPPVPALIIPVRSLSDGKRRLCSLLDDSQRLSLNQWFLFHMLELARQWPGLSNTFIVSPCCQVLHLAHMCGANAVFQSAPSGSRFFHHEIGLNEAVTFAAGQARKQGYGDLMVASVDLPRAGAADLLAMRAVGCPAGRPAGWVIATDIHGTGTNALFIPGESPPDFSFGPDSCQRHADLARQQGRQARVVHNPNLAADIDSPFDYLQWLGERAGSPADTEKEDLIHGELAPFRQARH